MKRVIITILSLAFAAGVSFAQDLATATELYNSAAAALAAGNKTEAVESFAQALEMAKELGADGEAIITNCKNAIPKVQLSIAKDLVKAKSYDEAIELCGVAAVQALEFDEVEIAESLNDLIPTALLAKGNALLSAKDYAAAAEAYTAILGINPTDGNAALRLGQSVSALGKTEEAIAAFELAASNGKTADANKQLSNIYVKEAAAQLKTKSYEAAYEAAVKSIEYLPSANAYKVAGTAAMNLQKKAEAIENLEKYLEASPSAADAAQIKAAIESLKK